MPVKFTVRKVKPDMQIVEFQIEGGVLDVTELPGAIEKAPEVDYTKGVCISGRGPIWLHVALSHKYHPTPFIANYDPRLGGCVVTSTHTKKRRIGEVIEV